MFGYIQPEKSELKVRQDIQYKAIYCGLCKAIGKECGQLPRFGLRYDLATLAWVLCDITDVSISVDKGNCILHPLRKHPIAKSNEMIEYCAHITTLLSYNKLDDMWIDDRSLIAPLGKAAFSRGYKKSKSKYPALDSDIMDALNKLHEYEKANEECFDYPASTTGDMMEAIIKHAPLIDDFARKALSNMMRNLGIWIYLADAIEDIDDDIKKENYNPLIKDGNKNDEAYKLAKDVMTFALVQAKKALDLLDMKDAYDIMDNVIRFALPNKVLDKPKKV